MKSTNLVDFKSYL